MKRGLLTERDREVLLGEATDLDDLKKRQNEIRCEVRKRKNNLIEDLRVLEEAGETGIVEDVLTAGTRMNRRDLTNQLDEIEDELARLRESFADIDRLEKEVAELKAQIED